MMFDFIIDYLSIFLKKKYKLKVDPVQIILSSVLLLGVMLLLIKVLIYMYL